MRLKLDLGRRVQLHSMDSHCHDITIGLYEHADESGRPCYVVHSYSGESGVSERLAFVAGAMAMLGGMERTGRSPCEMRWPCRDRHLAATKRLFLEACKLSKAEELAERAATIEDKKLGGVVEVVSRDRGRYEVVAQKEGGEARLKDICAGYLKLAEMERWEDSETGVRFSCGVSHDPLMRLLLYRAINARAALREQEMMASRGVLVAPSAQAQTP
jgi:hypothetical protein